MRCCAARLSLLTAILLLVCTTSVSAVAAGATPPSARFIVQLRSAAGVAAQSAAVERLQDVAVRHGLIVGEARHITLGLHLLEVHSASGESAAQMLARLRTDPAVEFAEPDVRRHLLAAPDDPLFENQWYLQNSEPAAVDALDAWSITTGSPGLVIADLDTGVRFDHPDLRSSTGNRLLPGYNLISNPQIANNSYGRGPDASDPGDWISSTDLQNPLFATCTIASSSWHGTRVAGILGALTNNATGIAGTTWQGWIEPVRVLGKCGGYDSDIIAGMAWAAGNPVEGVPANPYPASVLNMSLGQVGNCPASYQAIINDLLAEGVLIVVAAGNEGGPVDAPANCVGVAAVAGLRQVGTKVGFSSLGPQIALGAPAGNCVNTAAGAPCLFSMQTTTNAGTTVPTTNTYTNEFDYNVGTSFAAPLVAATAGLMLAVNDDLTPPQLIARMQAAAKVPFPSSPDPGVLTCHVPVDAQDLETSECNCTTSTCGAGMLDAYSAVLQAQRPIAAVTLPEIYAVATPVVLDASGSAAGCDSSLVSYQWTVISPSARPPLISSAGAAKASVLPPVAPITYTLLLTVTDQDGRTDSATVVVTASSASTTAPPRAGTSPCLREVSYSTAGVATASASAGSSGSGGGQLDVLLLCGLGSAIALRLTYNSRSAASSQARCARR
jgi:serine protease